MRLPIATVQSSWNAPWLRNDAEVELQRLDSTSQRRRHVVDDEMREIGLTRHRTQAGELRSREPRHVARVGMRIWHALEFGLVRSSGRATCLPSCVTPAAAAGCFFDIETLLRREPRGARRSASRCSLRCSYRDAPGFRKVPVRGSRAGSRSTSQYARASERESPSTSFSKRWSRASSVSRIAADSSSKWNT